MTEYAVLLAHSASAFLGALAHTAEVWLSRVNWEIVGYVGLALIALRVATWAFRAR